MGIFIGDNQSSSAARCALKLNYAVRNIVSSALKAQYSTGFSVRQVVGIDVSDIRAARTGVRGDIRGLPEARAMLEFTSTETVIYLTSWYLD